MPENIDAWDLFVSCSSSWVITMGGVAGLDYSAVQSIAAGMGIEWTDDLLRRIKHLETEQLQFFNKK